MSGYRGPMTGDGSAPFIGQRRGLWFQLGTPLDIPLADRLFWLENSSYQPLTGVSPYAATGWNDLWGLRNFTTLSGHPNIVDPSTVFFEGTRRCEFVQADQDCFVGPAPASDYAPFSSGTKATFVVSFLATDADATMILGATGNTGAAAIDYYVRIDNVNERVTMSIGRGGPTRLLTIVSPSGSVPAGSAHVLVTEFGDLTPGSGGSDVNDFTMWIDGTIVLSGELDAADVPNPGAPGAPMTLARRGAQVNEFFGGAMWHVIGTKNFYGRVLSRYVESRRV